MVQAWSIPGNDCLLLLYLPDTPPSPLCYSADPKAKLCPASRSPIQGNLRSPATDLIQLLLISLSQLLHAKVTLRGLSAAYSTSCYHESLYISGCNTEQPSSKRFSIILRSLPRTPSALQIYCRHLQVTSCWVGSNPTSCKETPRLALCMTTKA